MPIQIVEICLECEKETVVTLLYDGVSDSYYFRCQDGHEWDNYSMSHDILERLGLDETTGKEEV